MAGIGPRTNADTGADEPWELKDLFKDWLERHYPLKAKHIMSRVHEMRGGRDNDPCFGSRMVGAGLRRERRTTR